jgi:hypothetical protein
MNMTNTAKTGRKKCAGKVKYHKMPFPKHLQSKHFTKTQMVSVSGTGFAV